jgi:RimJ/RimL family protein N-acetyltransferase
MRRGCGQREQHGGGGNGAQARATFGGGHRDLASVREHWSGGGGRGDVQAAGSGNTVAMGSMTALETARLRLDPWTPAHAGMLARLAAMPEVMRHVGTGATWSTAEAEERAARMLVHWRTHGFGWRAAVQRSSGLTIGLIALNLAGSDVPELDDDDYEIGWWLDPSVWGQGYATEGGRAIVEEAFTRLGAPSVVARVRPANAASLGVAAALGLVAERDVVDRHGLPTRILRRHNPA